MKRKRTIMKSSRRSKEKEEKEEEDRLSDLPDYVLLHIMEFLGTREAVQTSVLSKRWKNLWKGLTTLSFTPFFTGIRKYNNYVSQVLFNRDHSISLHNLHLTVFHSTAPKLLNKILKYAALHHLHNLSLSLDFKFKEISNSFLPLIFNCQSLTFLEISINYSSTCLKLPPSLLLRSVKTLHLNNVTFTEGDNHCAEPFSTCTSLTTLVLNHSMHKHSARTLCISSPTISVLKLENVVHWQTFKPKLVLSTPNLSSITLGNTRFYMPYELSCTCNFSFLQEVRIDNSVTIDSSIIIEWLGLFSNMRMLTLSSYTLKILLMDLSMERMEIQPPYFARLESVTVELGSYNMISEEEINMVLEYLVQNCESTRVAVIEC